MVRANGERKSFPEKKTLTHAIHMLSFLITWGVAQRWQRFTDITEFNGWQLSTFFQRYYWVFKNNWFFYGFRHTRLSTFFKKKTPISKHFNNIEREKKTWMKHLNERHLVVCWILVKQSICCNIKKKTPCSTVNIEEFLELQLALWFVRACKHKKRAAEKKCRK